MRAHSPCHADFSDHKQRKPLNNSLNAHHDHRRRRLASCVAACRATTVAFLVPPPASGALPEDWRACSYPGVDPVGSHAVNDCKNPVHAGIPRRWGAEEGGSLGSGGLLVGPGPTPQLAGLGMHG